MATKTIEYRYQLFPGEHPHTEQALKRAIAYLYSVKESAVEVGEQSPYDENSLYWKVDANIPDINKPTTV